MTVIQYFFKIVLKNCNENAHISANFNPHLQQNHIHFLFSDNYTKLTILDPFYATFLAFFATILVKLYMQISQHL